MEGEYGERLDFLQLNAFLKHKDGKAKLCPTFAISPDQIKTRLDELIADGYEGLMLRTDEGKYRDGKRSKDLVKVKKFYDDEFMVVDISPSSEGWAILTCVTNDGKKFNCSAPGTFFERTQVMNNKDDYIGRFVNVEYSEWTNRHVPFHPIAKYWREKHSE